jgi:beta-glucosidase-like glycosyl hydrolase
VSKVNQRLLVASTAAVVMGASLLLAAAAGGPAAAAPAARSGRAQAAQFFATGVGASPVTVLAAMTEQQRVGQLFMAGVPATGPVSSAISTDISTYHTGSVILTGDSSAGVTATLQLTNQLQSLATGAATDGVPLFISTNQEGGNVQSLTGPGFSTMPTALSQGSEPTAELLQNAQTWGSQLVAAGVNLNLAPVLDTVPENLASTNQPIGIYQREYGYTPAAVTTAGMAFIQGMQDAGEGVVIKHFPGLGRASGNTDTTYGVTDDVTTYDDPYLQPYATAVSYGVQGVMVSEAIYTLIDPDHQAVFSPTVIGGMLRSELGYTGMIMSDSMEAAAVSELTPAEQAVDFIEAGGDLVLATDPTVIPAMYNAVLAQAESDPAFATLVDQAAMTVLVAKQQDRLLGANGGVLADVTGSGKPDIVAINPNGNMYLYPNTGGTGTSTFGFPPTLLGSGWTGFTLAAVANLSGSGLPGILAIDPSGNLLYYPNTGGTGTATFGFPPTLLGTGWTGFTVDVADINGDGKPDLLAINSSGDMYLYPNTGGTGTSTFGFPPTLVGTGWSGWQAIDVGFLTGAKGADVLVIDPHGNMYLYPNTGGTGTSTFGYPPTLVGTGWTGDIIN